MRALIEESENTDHDKATRDLMYRAAQVIGGDLDEQQHFTACGLTFEEALAMTALRRAASMVLRLPTIHEDLVREMAASIHDVQARLWMRPAFLAYCERTGYQPFEEREEG